jgi:hypothetical protein
MYYAGALPNAVEQVPLVKSGGLVLSLLACAYGFLVGTGTRT